MNGSQLFSSSVGYRTTLGMRSRILFVFSLFSFASHFTIEDLTYTLFHTMLSLRARFYAGIHENQQRN